MVYLCVLTFVSQSSSVPPNVNLNVNLKDFLCLCWMQRRDWEPQVPHPAQKPTLFPYMQGITGAFRPGVLTALMGASGAGKTTLMDVLACRKTSECQICSRRRRTSSSNVTIMADPERRLAIPKIYT